MFLVVEGQEGQYHDRVECENISHAFMTLDTNFYQGMSHPLPDVSNTGIDLDIAILTDLVDRGYSITFLPGDN